MTGRGDRRARRRRDGRPTLPADRRTCIRISLYWLGLTAIDGAVGASVQSRLKFDGLVPSPASRAARSLAIVGDPGVVISVLVQPTVGSISDYTITPLGPAQAVHRHRLAARRRVPDRDRLTSNSLLAIAAFVALLLQFSTNIARARSRATSRTSCPTQQVGLASALVGLMQVLGNVVGFALAAIADVARRTSAWRSSRSRVVELVTMLASSSASANGPAAQAARAAGRGASIAAETWGTDILRERSYVWLRRVAAASS